MIELELMRYYADISGANIAFTASKLARLSKDALFNIVGRPEWTNLSPIDGTLLCQSFPRQIVRKAGWDDWTDEDEEDIRLIDWGQAFRFGRRPAHLAQPRELKAPETIFTSDFDHRVDLWRAGCVVRAGLSGSNFTS